MPDLFAIFRWLGFVFVTIYVTITTAQSLIGWYKFLWQRDRYIDLLRSYVIAHALRMRLSSFGGDAMICVLLSVAFLLMWRVHIRLNELNVALERTYAVRHVKWNEPSRPATRPATQAGRDTNLHE
ncbi:hypothetical protein EON77_08025 [bacterium]|nr:MAG: hypothetical protein EON77_08025 [bacterium]